jgi:hypothetical protein
MERDPSFRYSYAEEFQRDLLQAKAAMQARRSRAVQTGRHAIHQDEAQSDEWDMPTRQLTPRRVSGMR